MSERVRRNAARLLLFLTLAGFGVAASRQQGPEQRPKPSIEINPYAPPHPGTVEEIERGVLGAINDIRSKAGLSRLALSPALTGIARRYSEEMKDRKFFSHRSPDGIMTADRLREGRVTDWTTAGENLAKVHGFLSVVKTAAEEWMSSDDHRHTILDGRFKRSGVGAAIDKDGTVFLTQLFVAP